MNLFFIQQQDLPANKFKPGGAAKSAFAFFFRAVSRWLAPFPFTMNVTGRLPFFRQFESVRERPREFGGERPIQNRIPSGLSFISRSE